MNFVPTGESKRKILSLLLIDYYKTASILYDFKFIDSTILSSSELPLVLNAENTKISSKEFYEIISLVDYMKKILAFSETTRKAEEQMKVKTTFPILDLAVFGIKKGNKYFKLIFEKYPSVEEAYYFLLATRENFMELEEISDIINFSDRVLKVSDIIKADDFDIFLEDFASISTSILAEKISHKLLQNIEESSINFPKIEHSGIIDSKKSILHMISYVDKSNFSNSVLSNFSHYIYVSKYYEKLIKINKNHINKIININNSSILEKLFNSGSTNHRLNEYIENLARKELLDIIKNSGSEILKIIASNHDTLSEDSNDSIFIIYMIVEIKEKIKMVKNKIIAEMKHILDKNIPFEYRLTELELYVKILISKQLDNKKIVSNSNELLDGFYDGVSNEYIMLLNEVFDSYETEEGK